MLQSFSSSPDGLLDDAVVEVKCPSKAATVSNFLKTPTSLQPKALSQIQLQIRLTGKDKGIFCVADPNFETNKKVTVVEVEKDDEFLQLLLEEALLF